jgi:hypothetical protein
MTEKKVSKSPFGDKVSVGAITFHIVAQICCANGQSKYTAVSSNGTAVTLTPERRLEQVTFSPPPKNTGVRRVCWHHVKTYPV